MDTLPIEIVEIIWSYLTPEDCVCMSLTSKSNYIFFKHYINLIMKPVYTLVNNLTNKLNLKLVMYMFLGGYDFVISGIFFHANNFSYIHGTIKIDTWGSFDDSCGSNPDYVKFNYSKEVEFDYNKFVKCKEIDNITSDSDSDIESD